MKNIALTPVATIFASAATALAWCGASAETAERLSPDHESYAQHEAHASAGEEAHEALTLNAPEGYKSAVPKYALFGKKGKFWMGIGGYAEATVGVDAGDVLSNPNSFVTANLTPATDGRKQKFSISAQQSMIYLNAVGLPGTENQVGTFMAMNFLGDGYAPVFQYAYIKYRGFTVGYDYTLFADCNASPPAIDYQGPNAVTAMPVGTVTYRHQFGHEKRWTVGMALQMPILGITNTNSTNSVGQVVPDIPFAAKYCWDGGNAWVRLSGVVRNMYYHNKHSGKNVDVFGYGGSFSGRVPVAGGLQAYWTGTCGRGIASFIQDLYGLNYDLVPDGDSGNLKANFTWGAYGGLQYDFSPKVTCSATYSHVRNYAGPWGNSPSIYGEQYKYAQYVLANAFWDINSWLTAGIEYIYGRRVNYDSTQSHDNRIQTMLKFVF